MQDKKKAPTFAGSRNIDVSALDSISRWMLQIAGKTNEDLLVEENMRKICLPKPLIPEDFDPDTLPDISNVPGILYTRPVWQSSNLGELQRLIRAEFLSRFCNLDQVRSAFQKNWLHTDDVFDALGSLLERRQCFLTDLREEDAQMLGMTPEQFKMFSQSGICITCASEEMRELAREALNASD